MRILLTTTVNRPFAARLAGAFAGLGCTVDAVFPARHVIAASRYLRRGFPYRPLSARASLARAVGNARPDLVLPCDDRALHLLLALDGIDELLARSLGALENYPAMMARAQAIAVAREEGLMAPPTIAVEMEKNLWRALDAVGLPAVLKSDGSRRGVVVKSPDEALKAFRRLANPPSRLRSLASAVMRGDAHFLLEALAPHSAAVNVQRFVSGTPAITAFACRDGEVLAAIHMDVVAWRGSTGRATVVRRADCPHMDEGARRLARRFRLSGLQSLDFVRDAQGVPHLTGINPRATQIYHLALGAGHDLPAALLGQPARPLATEKSLVALFPQPRRMARDMFDDVPWDDPGLLRATMKDGPVPARPVLKASPG